RERCARYDAKGFIFAEDEDCRAPRGRRLRAVGLNACAEITDPPFEPPPENADRDPRREAGRTAIRTDRGIEEREHRFGTHGSLMYHDGRLEARKTRAGPGMWIVGVL